MIKSDGGPSGYYDLPKNCVTLNDLIEYKSWRTWLGDSFHLANIMKAAWRWGSKDGVDKAYDARKFIYSGARLLQMHAEQDALRELLHQMLEDRQFRGSNETTS